MKTYRGHQVAEPGIYLNLRELTFKSLDEEGRLPGTGETTWRRVPALLMLVAAPVISIAFFIFLPLIGFLMLAGVLGVKLYELGRRLLVGAVPVLRPAWQPARAFLSRGKPAREEEKEEAEEKAEDRWAEEAREEAREDDEEE